CRVPAGGGAGRAGVVRVSRDGGFGGGGGGDDAGCARDGDGGRLSRDASDSEREEPGIALARSIHGVCRRRGCGASVESLAAEDSDLRKVRFQDGERGEHGGGIGAETRITHWTGGRGCLAAAARGQGAVRRRNSGCDLARRDDRPWPSREDRRPQRNRGRGRAGGLSEKANRPTGADHSGLSTGVDTERGLCSSWCLRISAKLLRCSAVNSLRIL